MKIEHALFREAVGIAKTAANLDAYGNDDRALYLSTEEGNLVLEVQGINRVRLRLRVGPVEGTIKPVAVELKALLSHLRDGLATKKPSYLNITQSRGKSFETLFRLEDTEEHCVLPEFKASKNPRNEAEGVVPSEFHFTAAQLQDLLEFLMGPLQAGRDKQSHKIKGVMCFQDEWCTSDGHRLHLQKGLPVLAPGGVLLGNGAWFSLQEYLRVCLSSDIVLRVYQSKKTEFYMIAAQGTHKATGKNIVFDLDGDFDDPFDIPKMRADHWTPTSRCCSLLVRTDELLRVAKDVSQFYRQAKLWKNDGMGDRHGINLVLTVTEAGWKLRYETADPEEGAEGLCGEIDVWVPETPAYQIAFTLNVRYLRDGIEELGPWARLFFLDSAYSCSEHPLYLDGYGEGSRQDRSAWIMGQRGKYYVDLPKKSETDKEETP